MNFADLIAVQRNKQRESDDERIRKQAVVRATKRLRLTDAVVIKAFTENAAQARAAGDDPEPALMFAESLLEMAA